MTTLSVRMCDRYGEERKRLSVRASVQGPLAIHRFVGSGPDWMLDRQEFTGPNCLGFSISHVPTGHCLLNRPLTLTQAQALRRALLECGVDWNFTEPAACPPSERRKVSAVVRQVLEAEARS